MTYKTNMPIKDANDENINEFLRRAPVIRMDIRLSGIPTHRLNPNAPYETEDLMIDPRSVKINTEAEIIYDERDNPSGVSLGSLEPVSIRGLDEDHLTPELRQKIAVYLSDCIAPLLGRKLDEITLKLPIDTCSAFFEGLKIAGVVKDYSVTFDLENSSHRTRSITYVISIQPVDSQLWKKMADQLWDCFVSMVTDPRTPTIAERFPELVAHWSKVAVDMLQRL